MDKKKEYMEHIKGQIEYFDRKSIKEKRRYYLFSIIALVSNAVIPILSTFSSMPSPYKQIVAILSTIAAIANGLVLITNSGKNWKHYRDCFTDLSAVTRAYMAGAADFGGKDEEEAFALYAEKCEAVLKNDRESWEIGSAKAGKP